MQTLPPSTVLRLAFALLAGACLPSCSAVPSAAEVPAASAGAWLAITAPAAARAAGPGAAGALAPVRAPARAAASDGDGVLHGVLLYIPDRIFDLLDIVRLRLRVGPGFAADIRATDAADAYLGFYSSIFIGIPGPRGAAFANWPIGYENRSGAELSVVDLGSGGRDGPHYGRVEFGLGLHVALFGLDLGVDPWEAVDFVAGLVTVDLVGDDL
ncbi:MAG TPA: hypothetical protein VK824_09030 [Planctomycetota bacterium]|nr:hypothetical protein [Planctomycetota bacterium]